MNLDLRCGRWQDVLADVECDLLCSDPPYGARTHERHRSGVGLSGCGLPTTRRDLDYGHWSPDDVAEFVRHWSPRTRGWMVCMTSHDLAPAWQQAFEEAGRYAFAPLPCVIPGMTVRLAGDGPSSWCVWLMVARHRNEEAARWGTLKGAYVHTRGSRHGHIGGKPIDLMRDIVRDYSRPGDLVCDPCAGGGTTLRAAVAEGRRAVGAEVDPETWARAMGLAVPERREQGVLL